jgi:hypothetical protein
MSETLPLASVTTEVTFGGKPMSTREVGITFTDVLVANPITERLTWHNVE